jgi:hypothetical protein
LKDYNLFSPIGFAFLFKTSTTYSLNEASGNLELPTFKRLATLQDVL